MTISTEFRHAFNFYRCGARFTASRAIAAARIDEENHKRAMAAGDTKRAAKFRHYPSSPWRKPCGNGVSTDGARWIETPSEMGLRFVGYCDQIRDSIGHTGWFTDPYQDSKIRGVVYQLPGRDGKARFVAGHDNADHGAADCDGAAYVDFSRIYESDFVSEMHDALRTIGKAYQSEDMKRPGYWAESAHDTAKKEAARAADSFAEKQAEKEREYQTAWQAGSTYSECVSELAENRKTILSTIRDIKGACAALRDLPDNLKARLRASLENDLAERESLFAKMSELASGDYDGLCFYPGETEKAAFNDGAGRPVLA